MHLCNPLPSSRFPLRVSKTVSAFALHAKYWRLLSISHITTRGLQHGVTSPSCVIKHLSVSQPEAETCRNVTLPLVHLAKRHTNGSFEKKNTRICLLLTYLNLTKENSQSQLMPVFLYMSQQSERKVKPPLHVRILHLMNSLM